MKTKQSALIVIFLFLTFMFIPILFAKNILIPIDSFPPFHIIPQNGDPPYGETISVLKAVVEKVNEENGWTFQVIFTKDTPFKRCLKMMNSGQADIIGGILDKEDRKEYMHLLKYKQNSNKVFLQRKTDNNNITKFEDLRGQTVGTIIGYVYFKQFDIDPQIIKDPVRNLFVSLNKLKVNRYNVVICTETEWITLQKKDPKFASNFKEAVYKYEKSNPVYLGISKKSWLSQRKYIDAFGQTVEEMLSQSEFTKIISDFYEKIVMDIQ